MRSKPALLLSKESFSALIVVYFSAVLPIDAFLYLILGASTLGTGLALVVLAKRLLRVFLLSCRVLLASSFYLGVLGVFLVELELFLTLLLLTYFLLSYCLEVRFIACLPSLLDLGAYVLIRLFA